MMLINHPTCKIGMASGHSEMSERQYNGLEWSDKQKVYAGAKSSGCHALSKSRACPGPFDPKQGKFLSVQDYEPKYIGN